MNSALPFTLDHPLEAFRKCLREENWSKAFNYQLDFLETGAAYTSVVLLGLFRKEALKGQPVPVRLKDPGAAAARAYLDKRGLRETARADWGIGYAPEGWDFLGAAAGHPPVRDLDDAGLLSKNDKGRTYDRFRGRIMFPIRDANGKTVAFSGRILPEKDDGRTGKLGSLCRLHQPEKHHDPAEGEGDPLQRVPELHESGGGHQVCAQISGLFFFKLQID